MYPINVLFFLNFRFWNVIFFCIVWNLGANDLYSQPVDYQDLTPQEQADFSRWLGWVWGDGLPNDLNNLTGIRYTGPNSSQFDNRYRELVDRLLESPLGLVLEGGNNRRRILDPWDYWTDAIPGGNPNDPQLLIDAVKNPNFLAGIIDTEGGNCGSTNNNYYIDDHTFSPSHPDTDRGWGLLNFGPNRMIQLFHLIGGVYGFEKTRMEVGVDQPRYLYGDEVERNTAILMAIDRFNDTKAHNIEALMNGETGRSLRIRIYIDEEDWDTFRSYGYWTNPSRYPNCNNSVETINGNLPLTNLPLAEATSDDCEIVGLVDLQEPNVLWYLSTSGEGIATLVTTNGRAEIDIQSPGSAPWNVSLRHQDVALEQGKSYHISFDAYAEHDRTVTIILNNSSSSIGYFFRTHQITTVPTNYTHEFTMNEPTDLDAFMRFSLGNQMSHKVFFENIRLVEADCVCPEERVFVKDMNNAAQHFESSQFIFGSNLISGSSSIDYDAGVFVELQKGFEVRNGAIFHAFIDGCGGI
jgi:hypothetical protein